MFDSLKGTVYCLFKVQASVPCNSASTWFRVKTWLKRFVRALQINSTGPKTSQTKAQPTIFFGRCQSPKTGDSHLAFVLRSLLLLPFIGPDERKRVGKKRWKKRISFFFSTEEEEEEGRAHNCADLQRQLDAKKSLSGVA